LEDFLFFSYTFLLMNRRSISDGSDRTEMAGARLELNGASKSRIIVTEPLPAQYHIASLVQKAPAPMALASQGVSENLKEPHHIGGMRILVVETGLALMAPLRRLLLQ
jgi:hypothetical protein